MPTIEEIANRNGGLAIDTQKANTVLQAIETKYLGPTDRRGARVKATCEARSVTRNWDHSLNVEQNHRAAAEHLQNLMDWSGRLVQGGNASGTGYCFVQLVD